MSLDEHFIVGPCPGCDAWQLEFDPKEVSPREVEEIVTDHANNECPTLMAAIISSIMRASPENPPDVLVGMQYWQVIDPDWSTQP